MVRDFLSLNKIEILPWDYEAGFFTHRLKDPFPQEQTEVALYDRIAALTLRVMRRSRKCGGFITMRGAGASLKAGEYNTSEDMR